MRITTFVVAIATAATMGAPAGAKAQEHQHGAGDASALGKVHFETSCSPAVREQFDRAIALLHSFWFPAAIDSFTQVASADPSCGMAHWGVAMSIWSNPFGALRTPKTLADGLAAVERAKATGAKTERERDYIAAAELLYRDSATLDHRARTLAYEKAMERIYKKYPEDREAAAFYALALDQTALPTDKTYANQLKAAAILEQLFKEQPDHPGVAHYIIHSYDVPSLAPKAIDAARRYAKIAPAAPHALHMPSHTFTRLGYWEESIETNLASAAAARKASSPAEVLHAYDYQVYAYLQVGQDRAAKGVVDETLKMTNQIDAAGGYGPTALFAAAAIPARYALERNAWTEASALEPRASNLPFTDAMTHFARAVGTARAGRPAAAAPDVERLAAIRDALAKANDTYWAEQVEIQRMGAAAWVAFAQGNKDEGLRLMREAADREDLSEKSAISPGPLAPARELLGEMLLEAGRPADALKEFEVTKTKEPNRFKGVYGAAVAAERAGNQAKARTYYAELLSIAKAADQPGRSELDHARTVARETGSR